MFKTQVIDNCIPLEQQNLIISKMITNGYFPWYYISDVTYGNKSLPKQDRPALSHKFIYDKKDNSEMADFISSVFSSFFSKPNIIACRSLLQFPLNKKLISSQYDTPHIDLDVPHTVYLYYVINADGATFLFKNSKVIKKVAPKQGRLLIFDGSIRHTAEQPKKGIRCIINFDVIKNV
jgi:hypothetical protein